MNCNYKEELPLIEKIQSAQLRHGRRPADYNEVRQAIRFSKREPNIEHPHFADILAVIRAFDLSVCWDLQLRQSADGKVKMVILEYPEYPGVHGPIDDDYQMVAAWLVDLGPRSHSIAEDWRSFYWCPI